MSYEIRLAGQAVADLHNIYTFIAAESSQAAAKWYRGLEAAILTLQHLPDRCPSTPQHPSLRHLLYGSKPHVYRIIFAVDESARTVNIAQIRHGHRHPISH